MNISVGTKIFYAAYGMNLCDRFMQPIPRDAFPHDPYPLQPAVIKDYKLVFRTHANIEPCEGAEVPVGVWAITEAMEKKLDQREGYPTYYDKQFFDIDVPGYGRVNAMAYVMKPGHEITPPDDYYEGLLREGYQNWNLDVSYLNRAIAEAEKAQKEAKDAKA